MSNQKTASKGGVKWRRIRAARRISQGIFLLFFLWLIALTVSRFGSGLDASQTSEVSFPVELFLQLDPYAGGLVLLSTGTIPGGMILGLITLISGFLLGRGFCGWVCPMGTMNHLVGEMRPGVKGAARIRANKTRPYQKIKYIVLIIAAMSALFGSAIGGLFDPLCLATRGIALTVVPVLEWLLRTGISAAYAADFKPLAIVADGFVWLSNKALLSAAGTLVEGGVFLSVLFIAVLAANRFIPRFWCRGLCPLGAMLGISGRFGVLSLRKDTTACTSCGKCELSCQGAASPKPGDAWQRAECDLCMNCTAACAETGALAFGLSGYKIDEAPRPDLKRRQLLSGAAAGATLVPVLRTGVIQSAEGRPNPLRIRPPGAVSEKDFLTRCIRCGQCMKICPNNALHPAVDEAGLEGLWTPVLIPRVGYCEPTCTLCTQVCPTGAILHVTEKEKVGNGDEKPVKIGTAFVDRGRCLPWAMNTSCIVCEEFCPVSPKAIVPEDALAADGKTILKRPVVHPDRCTGCGACENICPVNDQAAIRVSAVGETREPSNMLLQDRRVRRVR